jgi:heavy metal sensor kinase
MSIRLRLTLWYVILLAVTLIVFSGGLYAILSFNLRNEMDRTLQTRASEVQNSIELEFRSDPRTQFSRGLIRLPPADNFATPGIFVQVSMLDGNPVTRSENLGDQSIKMSSAVLSRVSGGDSIYTNLMETPANLRVYASPLKVRGQVVGVIAVAATMQNLNDTMRRLATLMGGGIVAVLILAFLVGAFLAHNALVPMDRITRTAQSIAHSSDLTRRIPQSGTQDEVGRLAVTFNEMLGRIEELFRSQQRFVADVSHELRSPLTAIRGNLDLLRRGAAEEPEARHQALAAIDSESERMQRLVADLLLLARADEGIKIQKQTVELDTLLLDVYREGRLLAGDVKISMGNEDQAQVIGDPDRLKQLLLNLVDNAIKYTPSGGQVVLSLDRDTQWVRVTVADNGMGIPAENLPKIFDRFYRVDKARVRDNSNGSIGGTGLGLAIVKWIAEAHGGRIEVVSEVGKGSTFTLWLPLAA